MHVRRRDRQPLGCPPRFGFAFKGQEVVAGLSRLASGGDDRLAVIFQDLDPAGEVLGVVGTRLDRNAQSGAEERCTEFRDLSEQSSCLSQLFHL